jgi:hypothetical protein
MRGTTVAAGGVGTATHVLAVRSTAVEDEPAR